MLSRLLLLLFFISVASGCATQRYGRQQPVSAAEEALLSCDMVQLEVTRCAGFIEDVRAKNKEINGAVVLGVLGDLGIGNQIEYEAAIKSGFVRLNRLQTIQVTKACVVDHPVVVNPEYIPPKYKANAPRHRKETA